MLNNIISLRDKHAHPILNQHVGHMHFYLGTHIQLRHVLVLKKEVYSLNMEPVPAVFFPPFFFVWWLMVVFQRTE